MKIKILLHILIILVTCNCQQDLKQTPDDDTVLAEWYGGKITLGEFRDIYLETPKSIYKNNFDFDSLHIELKNYVEIKEILKLTDSLSLDTVAAIKEKYKEYFTLLSLYKIMEDSVKNKVITEDMINNMFENMKYEFNIRHILVPNGRNSKKTADSLFVKLTKFPDSFAEVASEYSKNMPSSIHNSEPVWVEFDDLQNEFKKVIKAKDKGKIYKPFKSKFGYNLIKIEDIQYLKDFNKLYSIEKHKIYSYFEKEYVQEIDSAKYIFDDFLFRKYNIKIDTVAVDKTIKYLGSFNDNQQQYASNDSIENIKRKTVIATYGNLSFNFNHIRTFFDSYNSCINNPDRYRVIESVHALLRRILVARFSLDAGYDKDTFHANRIRLLMTPEYRKYYIYNYIIPKIAGEYETGKISEFPSLSQIEQNWKNNLFTNLNLKINQTALGLIK